MEHPREDFRDFLQLHTARKIQNNRQLTELNDPGTIECQYLIPGEYITHII